MMKTISTASQEWQRLCVRQLQRRRRVEETVRKIVDDVYLPGDGIHVHEAEDLPLGFRHERVARPDEFIHFRHGLGAEGHRGDGLRAAHLVDLVHLQQARDRQDVRVHVALGVGRRGHDHPLDPGLLRRDDRHVHR